MQTEKLFENDSYLKVFRAVVLSCTKEKDGYIIVLDRTAFYPEGGGQPGDCGELGNVHVSDTHIRDGEILHFCSGPLTVGAEVEGRIDWDTRFDRMQQHSGEHIVSGIICRTFSCDNVGFHMGAEMVVIDFNHPITQEQLTEVERKANAVIWENRPFEVSYPGPVQLKELPYRSKKELAGIVRIVTCPDADCCACCGTHVRSAGEIGLIKLISVKPFRDGVRIEMLSGRRAYDYVCAVSVQNSRVSVLLSAKVGETASAVERLQEELADVKYRMVAVENRSFEEKGRALAETGDVLLFEENLSPDSLRRCSIAVGQSCGGCCAVFSGADSVGWKYAISSQHGDVRALVRDLNNALRGRGGGKPELAQGAIEGSREEIESFFRERDSWL